jgi:hypothetical protein
VGLIVVRQDMTNRAEGERQAKTASEVEMKEGILVFQ